MVPTRRQRTSSLNGHLLGVLWVEIRQAALINPYLQQVTQKAAQDPTGNFALRTGLFFYKHRIVIP